MILKSNDFFECTEQEKKAVDVDAVERLKGGSFFDTVACCRGEAATAIGNGNGNGAQVGGNKRGGERKNQVV